MKLNEDALFRLLQSPEGPVGRLMEEKAQQVVDLAKDRIVGTILSRNPVVANAVALGVDWERQGDGTILIGIRGEQLTRQGKETASWYLAKKEAKVSEGGWMKPALAEVFPGGKEG